MSCGKNILSTNFAPDLKMLFNKEIKIAKTQSEFIEFALKSCDGSFKITEEDFVRLGGISFKNSVVERAKLRLNYLNEICENGFTI